MGWADNYVKQLKAGMTVKFRPRGKSMSGKIEDGQLVTVQPIRWEFDDLPTMYYPLHSGDVVLCTVKGKQYLHLIRATDRSRKPNRYQIGNNHGKINGWITRDKIYGLVIQVEP